MAKKTKRTKKTDTKGTNAAATDAAKTATEAVTGAPKRKKRPLPTKTATGKGAKAAEKDAKKAGDGSEEAPVVEVGAGKEKAKAKAKSTSGAPKAFSTHLHDYDIGQPKPKEWEESREVPLPDGAGSIHTTLYFGQFGDAKHLDDKGEEIPFERKADRVRWIAAAKAEWRRTVGGDRLRQKCRGRLTAIISKVKYIGIHQGMVITEDMIEKLTEAGDLLETIFNSMDEKGILVDPETGDAIDHELNTLARESAAKAS